MRMEAFLDSFTAFLADKWFIVAIALLLVILIVKVVKTVIKWLIIVVIIAGVLVYGGNYEATFNQIKDTLVDMAGQVADSQIQKTVWNAIEKEAKEAQYTSNPDGSFTIQTKSLKLEGRDGSADVKVTVLGQSFNLKVDSAVRKFIDQAKQNNE